MSENRLSIRVVVLEKTQFEILKYKTYTEFLFEVNPEIFKNNQVKNLCNSK